jgi:hypothetical protein
MFYVEALDLFYEMDNHTLPQVAIFEYYGFNRIDYFLELEKSSDFLRLTDVEFPYEANNASNISIKRALSRCLKKSDLMQNKLRTTYRKDIEFFWSHGIDVASPQALP